MKPTIHPDLNVLFSSVHWASHDLLSSGVLRLEDIFNHPELTQLERQQMFVALLGYVFDVGAFYGYAGDYEGWNEKWDRQWPLIDEGGKDAKKNVGWSEDD